MPNADPARKSIDPGANVAAAAARFGGRVAVVDGGRRFSFRDVHRRSNRLANALLAHGLPPEGRVAKLMDNRAEIIEIGFAVAKAGGASVNLHARNGPAEHVQMLEDAEAEFLFVDEAHRAQVPAVRAGCARLRHVIGVGWEDEGVLPYEDWLGRASDAPPGVEVAPDHLYHLHYTSGSTGGPKGVINTHRTHRAWIEKFFRNVDYPLGTGDAMIHAGPLTHASFNYTETVFLRGARSIVLPRFDPERFLDAVARDRGTLTYLVPAMILMLLDCEALPKTDLASLHSINYGAAPISEENLCRAIGAFGPVFRQIYGLTEARQPISILAPGDHCVDGAPEERARLASAGRPAAGVELALLDEEDRPVPPGEIGEICVRGDYAMAGYWKQPEETARTIRGGWVHTGDLARTDAEGYLFIVDRKKDMIISGGFNVYPAEVERALGQHPGVREAVVFGVPDERWGEAVAAAVVPRPGAAPGEEELIAFVADRIARYKRPRRIVFLDDLPRNARGKVGRREIRDRYWKDRERKIV